MEWKSKIYENYFVWLFQFINIITLKKRKLNVIFLYKKYPKYYVCDINGRFIFNINGKSTDNFDLEVGDVQILEEGIDKTYQIILYPVLENGLGEYYKILPECIVSATLRTKKYLGME